MVDAARVGARRLLSGSFEYADIQDCVLMAGVAELALINPAFFIIQRI